MNNKIKMFSPTKVMIRFVKRLVDSSRKKMYDLIFAVALAGKVSPTKLAKALDTDKAKEYANKFLKALNSEQEKKAEKTKAELRKAIKKAGVKGTKVN